MVREMRQKGEMMDKRTARIVHGKDFRLAIERLRKGLAEDEQQKLLPNRDGSSKGGFEEEANCNIYVRKRPMLSHEAPKGEYDVISTLGKQTIVVHDCQMHPDMKRKFINSTKHHYTRVFDHNVETSEVYIETTKPLLEHVMKGGKAVVMMNGQTGSGKSHTMNGLQALISKDLFDSKIKFDVSLMMVEITGAKVFDLLNCHQAIKICDDGNGNLALLGCSNLEISSADELKSQVQRGNEQRAVESTKVNSVSSRSHCICRISLHHPGNSELFGQLTLLDLAGSERNADTSDHTAERIKESIEINKSHMALKHCIHAFAKRSPCIPYRSSMLTRILKDCMWEANTRAAIIATISPIPTDTEHTLATLKYATLMKQESVVVKCVKTDVQNANALKVKMEIPVKEWTHEAVCDWFGKLENKKCFKRYVSNIPSSVNGRTICKFGQNRFVQLCDGDAEDGLAAFEALRKQLKVSAKIEKERREFNRMQQKKN